MKGMDGRVLNQKFVTFLRPLSVDFPTRRPEQTKTRVNPQRFGYVHFIRYRCIRAYLFLQDVFIQDILFPGILFSLLGTTAGIGYGFAF